MLKSNFLKKKLASRAKAIGTWCIIDSPMVVDVIASSNIDFIIIDSEHGVIDFGMAQTMCAICESHGVSPIMRVGEVNESLILRAMDIGVHGIQLPNVSSKKSASNFVQFAKYPPLGTRGFSPYTRASLYDVSNGQRLPEAANSNTLLIANVEGTEGLENLEEIVSVSGIDIIFIGLFDLSKSLGIPGQVENPQVIEKLDQAIDIIKKNGKFVGTIASSLPMLNRLKEKDIDYLTFSVDTGMLKNAYQELANSFSKA